MLRNIKDSAVTQLNENGQSIALHKNRNLSAEPKNTVSTPRFAFGDLRNHVTTPIPSSGKRAAFTKSTALRPRMIPFNGPPPTLSIPVMQMEPEEKPSKVTPVSSQAALSTADEKVHLTDKASLQPEVDGADLDTEDEPAEFMPIDTAGVIISPIKLNSSVRLLEDNGCESEQKEDLDDFDEPVESPYMGGNWEDSGIVSDLPEREHVELTEDAVVFSGKLAQRFLDALKVDADEVLSESDSSELGVDSGAVENDVGDCISIDDFEFEEVRPNDSESYEDLSSRPIFL